MSTPDFNFSFLTATEANYAQAILELVRALALGLDTTVSNLPSGAVHWSSANSRFEKYDGTSWIELVSLYKINADTLDGSHATAFATASHNHSGTYQPLDAELTALAALASAADKVPYFTGSGTAALATLTAAARTVLAQTTVAAMCSTLGAQPQDETLTALAALATSADQMIYATGSDTFALTSLTATARALLAASSPPSMRAVLGLGSAALLGTATADQIVTGTDTTTLTTPAAVAAVLAGLKSTIDTELASGLAGKAGIDLSNATTIPQALLRAALNASGGAPLYACRAWVNFNGTGTVSIRASGNVSSITDQGTGAYVVNFTSPMPDTSYAIGGFCRSDITDPNTLYGLAAGPNYGKSTTSFTILTRYPGGNIDSSEVDIVIFR